MKFNPFLFFEKSNRLRAVLILFIILCAFLFIIDFFVLRIVNLNKKCGNYYEKY